MRYLFPQAPVSRKPLTKRRAALSKDLLDSAFESEARAEHLVCIKLYSNSREEWEVSTL